MKNKYFKLYIISFFVFNIINTYFVTSFRLNSYIAPLQTSVLGQINSIIGNISVLLLFVLISLTIFKKNINKIRFLNVITLLLNVFILLLGYFTLFYSNTFHFKALGIFKNPASGISDGLFTIAIKELIFNYRILVFLPLTILLLITSKYKKNYEPFKISSKILKLKNITYNNGITKSLERRITPKRFIGVFLSSVLMLSLSIFTFDSYNKTKDILQININNSTNATENLGLYPYYLLESLGLKYDYVNRNQLNLNKDQELIDAYSKFNKNQRDYKNVIDGKKYNNEVLVKDTNLEFHDSLNLNDDDSITGIFEGKNLQLVHLESLNYFLFQIPEVNLRFKFLNELFKESVVFNNYYSSVGMGVSSDGEFSVLTGLYPSGDGTIYRDYEKYDLKLDSLASLMSKKDYKSKVFHGDFELFYNRNNAYNNLLGFTEGYYSLEDYAKHYGFNSAMEYLNYNKNGRLYNDELLLTSPWPSEFEVHDHLEEEKVLLGDKHFIYTHFLTQHTPFLFNPYSFKDQSYDIKNYNKVSRITKRYLEYTEYIDDLIKSIFFDPKDSSSRINEDTVYVFYSDHGSSLKGNDLSLLFDREVSTLEERKMLQQTVAFIYAPSSNANGLELPDGLIKGEQNLVRGHQDLYRTIGDLFNLFDDNDYYFGAHGFSNEPSFIIDNRIFDLVFDSKDLNKNYFVSLRNKNKWFPNNEYVEYQQTISDIIYFKKLSDLYIKDKSVYEVLMSN